VLDEHVSLRRVAVALRGLPMGAWPDPDHPASWSVTDHLLANLVDSVRELTWITAQANSKHKVKRPDPVFRPGQRQPRRQSWSDLARIAERPELADGRRPLDVRGRGYG